LDIWRRNGIISANEWRSYENLNEIEEEKGGDEYWMPSNFIFSTSKEEQEEELPMVIGNGNGAVKHQE
jgi:hypothetical protein